ncbi:signal peptidase I [Mucilaginibacter gilvus]|uniref:Signal peptidase I n=1 Tax=Mucilaginibacter gilvus TaxID=2305909 RepID=A0A3S3VL15_9SPHI|nr:signal peptidase I [Mucilaginibacter gilvus]RWY55652.1 signal peptidase I [Mucilaginibacter gilvus]
MKTFWLKHRGLLTYLLVMCTAVIVLRIFFISIFTVEQNSMNNSYINGDRVLVYKQFGPVNRYDVVIVRHHGEFYIKRCIGLPGDRIQIAKGRVSIDGRLLDEFKRFAIKTNLDSIKKSQAYTPDFDIRDIYNAQWTVDDFGPLAIPAKNKPLHISSKQLVNYNYLNIANTSPVTDGQLDLTADRDYYFVMGDNREFSKDSRSFGLIRADEIIGKVGFVVWPQF